MYVVREFERTGHNLGDIVNKKNMVTTTKKYGLYFDPEHKMGHIEVSVYGEPHFGERIGEFIKTVMSDYDKIVLGNTKVSNDFVFIGK